MNEIISLALESGIWAALFCFLFLYMLNDSRRRESKYTETIESLDKQLGEAISALKICEEIKTDCKINVHMGKEIKNDTVRIKEDVEALRYTEGL